MSTVDDILASGIIKPASEVTAWLGGRPLGVVPIAQGAVTESASGDVLGTLEITVPATPEWLPTHPEHPLANFGQELLVRRGFTHRGEVIGWETLGRFRTWAAEPDDDGWITVQADSVDVRLTGARWIVDTRTQGTFAAQARQICVGIVPVRVLADDRAAPSRRWEQQQSRRESLLELCDAWGTVPRIVDGQLTIVPTPRTATPLHILRSGPSGTVVRTAPEGLTDQVVNVVIASTAPEDETAPLSSMAAVRTGPRAFDGPYGQQVQFFGSPLLTTMLHCQQAANTRLSRLLSVAGDLHVTAVTDPRIRLDSVVRVIDEPRDTDAVVRVVEVRHALTPGREPGEVKGQVLSGRIGDQTW